MLIDKGAYTGLFFGATFGVITTLGLMVGLHAGTGSVAAVFGGVIVVTISDAMSDAMGIHLSEEADPDSTRAHIWAATLSTFFQVRRRSLLCVAVVVRSSVAREAFPRAMNPSNTRQVGYINQRAATANRRNAVLQSSNDRWGGRP